MFDFIQSDVALQKQVHENCIIYDKYTKKHEYDYNTTTLQIKRDSDKNQMTSLIHSYLVRTANIESQNLKTQIWLPPIQVWPFYQVTTVQNFITIFNITVGTKRPIYMRHFLWALKTDIKLMD